MFFNKLNVRIVKFKEINMDKKAILEKAKLFFKEKIVENHSKNTLKLNKLSEFNPNPFLLKYLANFAFGRASAVELAKILIYPRVLGTSINTTFGTQLQSFCSEVLSGYASLIPGIDIEFIDQKDGRRKYCQVKAGPNTINKDDVKTIKDHFYNIKNIARVNREKNINIGTDCIVGVFYGEKKDISTFYKMIDKDYPVYVGQDFWFRLTGDETFYQELIDSFADVANDVNAKSLLDKTINTLSAEIEKKYE